MLTINEKALEFPSERKTEGKMNRNFPFIYSSLIFLIFLSLLPPNITDLEEFSLNFYSSVTEVESQTRTLLRLQLLNMILAENRIMDDFHLSSCFSVSFKFCTMYIYYSFNQKKKCLHECHM